MPRLAPKTPSTPAQLHQVASRKGFPMPTNNVWSGWGSVVLPLTVDNPADVKAALDAFSLAHPVPRATQMTEEQLECHLWMCCLPRVRRM